MQLTFEPKLPVMGAEKAWASLHEKIGDTNQQAEDFTKRMISDLGHDATNAIMDFALGTASAEDAFLSFASSFLTGLAEMITQQLVFNAISGFGKSLGFGASPTPTPNPEAIAGAFPNFASGGVIPGGLGFQNYASGGPFITKPHLAMVGEGMYDEAVIPMPGGRAVPVEMRGGGGGTNINFQITAMDGADAKRVLMKERGTITAIIEDALLTTQSTRNAVRQVQ